MKKNYIAPAIAIEFVEFQSMVCASLNGVNGNSGLQMGEGTVPTSGDSRRRRNVWDDEDDDDLF
ncbi:MAG: hypothetical protein K6A96_16215 [Prevotella sp.]|nr:hypothetical protein [Prevotella sp.]